MEGGGIYAYCPPPYILEILGLVQHLHKSVTLRKHSQEKNIKSPSRQS